MQSWIRVNVGVPDEPKVIGLADTLTIEPELALGHVIATWCRIGEHAPDGDLSAISDLVLERWAGWRGERGRYAAAFREAFVQEGRMPGWDRLQGKLIELAKKDRARKEGASAENPRNIPGSSVVTVQDVTGQDVTERARTATATTTTTTTAPTRQPRESRHRVVAGQEPAPSRATWLTEPCAAWESTYGPGTFPMGQAARQLAPLRKAGFSSTEIAVRLAWYLRVRGLDTADPDPAVIERTRFTPSLKDFAQRFGAFDPSSGRGTGTGAYDPEWVSPGVKAWTREVGFISPHEFRRKLAPSVETHGEHTLLVAIERFGEHRRRECTLGYEGSLDAFARGYRDYVPRNLLGRPAMAIAPDTSEAA
ncbi:MAG: hypothetical protein IPJ78_13455 [Gemmatimonadetes bacterium]|nr:hypothetical protein [Gemmatimonadota bacterium]